MTNEQKSAGDYAELLDAAYRLYARLDTESASNVGGLLDAVRTLIAERDDTEAERAHHDIMSQSLRVDLDLMRQRAEAAEALLAKAREEERKGTEDEQ